MHQCDECCYKTERPYNLKRHVQNSHGKEYSGTIGNCVCQESGCSFRCFRVQSLREHLTKVHDIKFRVERVEHQCSQDFERWKSMIENENNCSFVKQTGYKDKGKHGEGKVQYFQCNRSGIQKKKGKGKRHSKVQGSCKINMNCTSSVVASVDTNGKITAEVCYDHYGHKGEMQHIWISDEIRKEVAAKLQSGIPYDRILDDVRESAAKIKRDHLLTKKDIENIEKCFGVNTIQQHPNDKVSVSVLMSEWQKLGEENPILFSKMQGESAPEGIDMLDEDCMIVIQNPLQRRMLQQFGPNGVCIDSTHGTNAYDFLLVTLLVIDEFGEGFPVAWCITNHEDFTSLCIMLTQLKAKCGNISAAWLMSDMAQQFYNAWIAIMGPDPKPQKLLCTWHVDKAWREELRKKIGDVEIEAETYKRLRLLLEESEEESFERNLVLVLEYLRSCPRLEPFYQYFQQYWPGRKEEWAFVFRKNCGVNTNMHVEAFHRVFKYSYLKAKSNKRLDHCLVALIKFARDKGFERIIKLSKGKISHRSKEIIEKHKKSNSMTLDCVNEIRPLTYQVTSNDKERVYVVEQVKEGSCCKVGCIDCGICIHSFTCNCPDNLAVTGICKHIHLARRWQMQSGQSGMSTSSTFEQAPLSQELDATTSLCQANNEVTVTEKKESIEKKLFNLIGDIRKVKDLEVLKEVDKQLSATHNLLTALQESSNNAKNVFPQKPERSKRKNLKTQDRFTSTKKKKQKPNIRFGRPSLEEKQKLISEMKGKRMLELRKDENTMKWLEVLTSPSVIDETFTNGTVINCNQLILESIPGKMLDVQLPVKAEVLFEETAWQDVLKAVDKFHQEWACELCKEVTFVNMIECDICAKWFHWSCANVEEEIEGEWGCNQCSNSS